MRDVVKECKLCKFGDGVCTQGFRKQHERTDPNCRLHGVTDRGNSRPRQSSDRGNSRPGQSSEVTASVPQLEGDAANAPRPLAELTQFRTRRGNLMLFAPQPMDTWIGKEVLEDQSAGGYRDCATGKPLTKKLAASYMAFCKRHTRRCRMGDVVDKYIRLVDKYQPKVFAEARMYVARFPEEAGDLLKQGPQADPQNAGETTTDKTNNSQQLGGSRTGDWLRCFSRQGNRPSQNSGGRANSEGNSKDKDRACDKGGRGHSQ